MNSNKSSSIIVILFFISALGVGACGSGGGGGTSTPTEIIYTGKTDPVHITAEKANLLMANILNGPGHSASSKPSNAPTASQVLPRLLSRSFIAEAASARRTILQSSQTLMKTSFASAAPNPVNQTEDCGSSGTVIITGSINDDGTGTLKLHYVDCNEGDGFTTNGDATFQVDAVDAATGIILDGTIRSTALRTEDAFSEVIFSGSIRSQVLLADQREILIVNGIFKDSRSAKLFKFESVVIVLVFDNYLNPTRHTETITGRIYDSVEGYVNIATQFPLIFSNEGLDFPDDGGPLAIIGAENSRARLIVVSASKARIEVDADGDSVFETAAFYSWTNLTGAPSPNEPPTGIVTLSPAAPKRDDTLTATVTASDPEDDPLTYAYAWTRNGTPIDGANTPTLDGNQFVKGDIVTVIVGLSDGFGSTSIIASITIGDSPLVADPTNPVNAAYGVPLELQLGVTDPDGDSVSYRLAYGPGGMQIDQAGKISWTPNIPMFDDTMEVHFGVLATAGGVTVESAGTVTVSDLDRARPLVRTSLQLPRGANGLHVADFNGDGKHEILVTDQEKLLYTLVFDGTNYVQDWVYPFDLDPGGSLTALTAHDFTGDSNPDIVLGAGSGLVILDGVSRKIIGQISDGYSTHLSIHVADIDHDGKKEIVYLGTDTAFFSTQLTINVYDAESLQLEWQSLLLDLGTSLAVGNVDNDPALEIVTANGYIYDGVTHENQWAYGPGFGFLVDTGDLNNDGVEEIVGAVQYKAIRAYSAVTKTLLWEIGPERDFSALLVVNIDADPHAEVLVGADQVIAYDGNSRVEQWRVNAACASNIAVGDVDDDRALEFVFAWSTCVNSDLLTVAGLNPSIGVEWMSDFPSRLDGPFVGARWLTPVVQENQAVFSGAGGTRVVGINPTTGRMMTSSEVQTAVALDGADYDGDGVDELFLTKGSQFIAYDLGRDVEEWTSINAGVGTVIRHGDMNGDGHDDLVGVTSDSSIIVFDVFNSTLIWKSSRLSGFGAFDLEVVDLDGNGVLEIIALSTDAVSIYEKNGTTYLQVMTIDINAIQLAVGDLDRDHRPDLIVAAPGGTSVSIYDGVTFNLKIKYSFSEPVYEFAISQDGSGNLLISTSEPFGTKKLVMVDGMTGTTIWSSPPLLGEVSRNSLSFADINDDGTQEILLGTSHAMYITRPGTPPPFILNFSDFISFSSPH